MHPDRGVGIVGKAIKFRMDIGKGVHPILPLNAGRQGYRLLPRHKSGRAKDIDPDIAQAATAAGRLIADVAHVAIVERKRARDMTQCADGTALDHVTHTGPLRVMHDHIGFRRQLAGRIARSNQIVKFTRLQGNRFFTKHMLARRQRLDCPCHMQVIGQRNIDRVNIRICQQRVIAVMDPQPWAKIGERCGLGRIRRRQRHQLRPLCGMDRPPHELTRKFCGPQNAPSYRFCHPHISLWHNPTHPTA
mmetsp:Transcript_29647/g.58673  ORF Transcript_29647/g.58673 Transcript_29647/m.58673 type:complete len:247 (+) Transcript_29647:1372-2112(+)